MEWGRSCRDIAVGDSSAMVGYLTLIAKLARGERMEGRGRKLPTESPTVSLARRAPCDWTKRAAVCCAATS